MKTAEHAPAKTSGILHDAAGYDLMMWLITLGRERAFREKVLNLAELAPGESVLDIGCGTGTLTVAAKRLVGNAGSANGIDASPEMIARARAKSRKAGLDATFETAAAEALPFPDARFDVVLSSMMLHHLPRKTRLQCLREVRRVLRPAGRLLVVDFQSSNPGGGFFGHFRRHRHGHVKLDDMLDVLGEAGMNVERRGSLGLRDLYFAVATPPERTA